MSKGIIGPGLSALAVALVLKDADGNVAVAAAPPVWSLDADGVVSLVVDGDGMSATLTKVAVGSCNVNVVVEGDPTPGVDTLHLSGEVQVLPAEAASGELVFGAGT